MNLALDKIVNWLDSINLRLNIKKSEIVLFTKSKRFKYRDPIIKITDNVIGLVSRFKYLGVIVDERLTWTPHLAYVAEKSRSVHKFICGNLFGYAYWREGLCGRGV